MTLTFGTHYCSNGIRLNILLYYRSGFSQGNVQLSRTNILGTSPEEERDVHLCLKLSNQTFLKHTTGEAAGRGETSGDMGVQIAPHENENFIQEFF